MPDLERKQTSGIEDPRYMLTLKDGFIRPAIRYGRMEEPVSFQDFPGFSPSISVFRRKLKTRRN
jgi:hypothetical protein